MGRRCRRIGGDQKMRVLVVGGGGREHTLVWKIRQSPLVTEVYCAPGNGGIAGCADCVDIGASDIVELADFAEGLKVGLTVVGPELPLTLGIVDEFQKRGLPIFGSNQMASRFEGSKVFAKEFMARHQIPTADFQVCSSAEEALRVVDSGRFGFPVVLKADGLAAGKGVIIAHDRAEAAEGIQQIMVDRAFGNAGDRLVLEQCLVGEELSFMVISDGKRILPLVTSQDHKAAQDGDTGPNTGGMGAYSPAVVTEANPEEVIMERVIRPAFRGMEQDGIEYRGVLYAGLMMTADGPSVLEFNCRFGDPETQVILPRLDEDLVPLMLGSANGQLEAERAHWRDDPAVCIVLASGGYPGSYGKGMAIAGLDTASASDDEIVFHAGTRLDDGQVVVNGGRVLGATALAPTLKQAIDRCYGLADRVSFDGLHRRNDIGWRALKHLEGK
jgi:phosphoribosylamine--glycine ligase